VADTRTAVFFGEAVAACQRDPMHAALGDLATLLRGQGMHVGPVRIADVGSPSFVLTL
jgi:hypothetical protein